jgi:hypothetical protein
MCFGNNEGKIMVKKYKKYKYRKVNPEIEKKMIALRKKKNGLKRISYKEIGEKFGVSEVTVEYHVNKEFRERFKERIRKKCKRNSKEYNSKYQKDRYNNDPEFRKKSIETTTKCNKKLKEKRKKLGVCLGCGSKKDKNHQLCKKCRTKRNKNSEKLRNKRKRLGLCLSCGNKPIKKHSYCRKCIEIRKINKERYEEKWKN